MGKSALAIHFILSLQRLIIIPQLQGLMHIIIKCIFKALVESAGSQGLFYAVAYVRLFPRLIFEQQIKSSLQLMKNTTNFYDLKRGRTAKPTKKPNCTNSIIYKQINTHLFDANKLKNNRDSKETIQRRESKDEEKTIASKKNSLNPISKKNSKADLSDIYGLYHKLNDNYLAETQEETRYEPEDFKHKKELKETIVASVFKKSSMGMKVDVVETRVEKALFSYLYIIGKGGFGKVWKVEHKKTKNQYAMKEMLKSIVMTKKSVQSVMNQRVLLSQFTSPFIVNVHFAFQDRDTLYLVLDLMEGGDLRHHIGTRSFNQIQSKFFIACIILGLEDLQRNNIIHRDIKPENLVLDSRGYIRITDLAQQFLRYQRHAWLYVQYINNAAPEVICRMNHSFVSDYFALGVIAYELMTGRRPYNGRSRNQIRDLMLAKEVQLRYGDIPEDWSCEAADFINKLIKRKPESRLGSGGIDEMKSHTWLHGLNWEKLRSKDIESPFIPMMKKSHFDQDEQITIEDEQEAELIEKNSLLLRKPQFQELFGTYYYSPQDQLEPTCDLKEKQKKSTNSNKRVISAYRKSSQQERDAKVKDLVPEKKFSYNDSLPHKKKIDLIIQKSENFGRPQEQVGDALREKKRALQPEKNFFR